MPRAAPNVVISPCLAKLDRTRSCCSSGVILLVPRNSNQDTLGSKSRTFPENVGLHERPLSRDPDVRFGSKADICSAKKHVRFTPKSGHVRCKHRCPLSANNGHGVPTYGRLNHSSKHVVPFPEMVSQRAHDVNCNEEGQHICEHHV